VRGFDVSLRPYDVQWLEEAIEITSRQIALFWDRTTGGFFDTSGTDPSILVRTRDEYDGAEREDRRDGQQTRQAPIFHERLLPF
jgi:uncharacterized protein YyaL (SSP411 family)